jgi:hypothetical protein
MYLQSGACSGAFVTDLCMLSHWRLFMHRSCVCLHSKGSEVISTQAAGIVSKALLHMCKHGHRECMESHLHSGTLAKLLTIYCMDPMYAHVPARLQPPCHDFYGRASDFGRPYEPY